MEKEFLDFCKSKNIVGVKGHRLVGGFRASTYNACTMEDVKEREPSSTTARNTVLRSNSLYNALHLSIARLSIASTPPI